MRVYRAIVALTACLSAFDSGKVAARTASCLNVTMPHGGALIGRYMVSHSGRGIRAFLGIPYAEPPIGEHRFASPVPASPWKGEKFAVMDSDICMQRDPFRRDSKIEGSEDCLYLNVYAPQFPETKGPLPVMVFYHGGGWECGSGVSSFYGPEYLLDHDVVYVSGNFRLGPLGFLSCETKECPGNFGLKDQVEILRWVQNNIAVFGGNPKSVTVFGESAGGASGTYLMTSPLSKGLFHRVISQSGTYFSPWAQPAHKGVAAKRALKVAKLLSCPEPNDANNWSLTMDCLRSKTAESITSVLYDFFEWDTDPMIPFPPVVEPEHEGAFITEHPRNIKTPHGLSLPWMTGITSEEGAMKSSPLLNIPGLLEDLQRNLQQALPIILNYDHHCEEIRHRITHKINDFYFRGGTEVNNLSKENHQNLTNLLTDGWFLSGLDEYLRQRFGATDPKMIGPTFIYLFDHRGQASFTEIFNGGPETFYGVCHADELQYLFPVGMSLFVRAAPSTNDNKMRESLVEMWVNFARTGNPTPTGSKFPKWKPSNGFPIDFARIGSKNLERFIILQNERGLFEERVNLWRNLEAHHTTIKCVKDEL